MPNFINPIDHTDPKNRPINLIRRAFPDLEWHWDKDEGAWMNNSGWGIRRSAQLAPRYDGDDDTFRLVYRRTDTGEEVYV